MRLIPFRQQLASPGKLETPCARHHENSHFPFPSETILPCKSSGKFVCQPLGNIFKEGFSENFKAGHASSQPF
jgi:hypothetical protein